MLILDFLDIKTLKKGSKIYCINKSPRFQERTKNKKKSESLKPIMINKVYLHNDLLKALAKDN